jgi:cation transport protein ChaC
MAFVVDRRHEQYAGILPLQSLLDVVRQAKGGSGTNADYVINTATHLRGLGIKDPTLEWLVARLEDARAERRA